MAKRTKRNSKTEGMYIDVNGTGTVHRTPSVNPVRHFYLNLATLTPVYTLPGVMK